MGRGFDPDQHHRRSLRLAGYDYTGAGAYFVTVCAHDRQCLFGEVVAAEMKLSPFGQIVVEEWLKTGGMRPRIQLDAFAVMPNHVHGILVIEDPRDTGGRGTLQRAPTVDAAHTMERFGQPTSDSIPTIVRLFKSAVAKRINEIRGTPGAAVWQRSFYEHVIRDEADWSRIRAYIDTNAARWAEDRENPDNRR